jgi:uncharacterized membrane protein YgcG
LLRGILVFNVPIGTEKYVQAIMRDKAMQVVKTTEAYVQDLGDEYPQELWTMLQFSLQHRVTYWLRTCTPEETKKMARTVDHCITEAVQVATGVKFETEDLARARLRMLARMKGGGINRAEDNRYPTFLGAMLDVLPRLIDRKDENGEIAPGVYPVQMKGIIGEGAYDKEGHRNTAFLEARCVGPYPHEMQQMWTTIRNEATANNGIEGEEGTEQWDRLGPLSEGTPAMARNRGAAERRRDRRVEDSKTQLEARPNGSHKQWRRGAPWQTRGGGRGGGFRWTDENGGGGGTGGGNRCGGVPGSEGGGRSSGSITER